MDNFRFVFKFMALILAAAFASSCSVKENRGACPCRVTVISDADTTCLVSFFNQGKALEQRKLISSAELREGDNRTDVTKGSISVNVLQGHYGLRVVQDNCVYCPEHQSSGLTRSWTKDCEATGEVATVKGTLQKQSAMITVKFVDLFRDYGVRLVSDYSGLNLQTLRGVRGEYAVTEKQTDGQCSFTMLRQADDADIRLYVVDGDGGATEILEVSSYLKMAGYSWNMESLDDVTIVIDFVKARVTVSVADWEEEKTFSFTI